MSSPPTKILILGGAGAQTAAVVRALSPDPKYAISILTRSLNSPQAIKLAALPRVSLFEGNCYNEDDLTHALARMDACFVNTNGFAIGEKNEIYWSIRIYEIAVGAGVKHFVYGGLDYASRKAGFDPKYRCGHYDGKGKFGEYLAAQPTTPTNWSIISSGPYIEMLSEGLRPTVAEDGTYIFEVPLADGAMPLIHLDDLGSYVKWQFDHPREAAGMNLEIATVHASGADIAAAFTAATGKPARYEPSPDIVEFGKNWWKLLPNGDLSKIGEDFAPGEPTLMSWRQNFKAWWELYRASGGNEGILRRDYTLLDGILPGRVRGVEEWMRKTGYDGEYRAVLKGWERGGRKPT